MAGWHSTAQIRQCDRACESVSRTGAGPRHRFCEWNTNPAIPSLQNHHIRHLIPALPRVICISLFPLLCSHVHYLSARERIASLAARTTSSVAQKWERSFQRPLLCRLICRAMLEILSITRAIWSRQRAITMGREGSISGPKTVPSACDELCQRRDTSGSQRNDSR